MVEPHPGDKLWLKSRFSALEQQIKNIALVSLSFKWFKGKGAEAQKAHFHANWH